MSNSWEENAKLILDKLATLTDGQQGTNEKLEDIRIDLAVLKVKAAMWGTVGGVIGSAIVSIIVGLILARLK